MSLGRAIRTIVGKAALGLSRALPGRRLIQFMVVNMSFALPVEKLRQTPLLLAFNHPKPSYKLHIILVPRRPIDNLLALGPEDAGFLLELFETVKSLVAEIGLEEQGYRLIVNGGSYQDFPLLHFHLISGEPLN